GASPGPLQLSLSPDQRILTVRCSGTTQDTNYFLTINSEVVDLATPTANKFDQIPSTPDVNDSFVLHLHTAQERTATLPSVVSGGGSVTRGNYCYVLERAGPLDGSLVVYDLTDPTAPVKAGELGVPGFPRDLALIPQYSFTRTPPPAA